jgi:hypothetical protein
VGGQAQERSLDYDVAEQRAPLRTVLALAPGGLGGDQPQPPDTVRLTDRQRHHHHPVPVAVRLPGLFLVERDRHRGPQHQPIDRLAATQQQGPQAAGEGDHEHVVDRGVMGVGDPLYQVEVAADEREAAVPADPPAQAGPRRPRLHEGLAHRRPAPPSQTDRGHGMGQLPDRTAQLQTASAQVIREQRTPGRHGRRRPRRRVRPRWIGDGINKRAEGGDPGDAVGDGVVDLHEQAHPPVGQAGQEPHLPQRPRPAQATVAQLLAGRQQL